MHALEQLLRNEKPPQGEARAPQLEKSPYSPQLEKACTQQPGQPKKYFNAKKKKKMIALGPGGGHVPHQWQNSPGRVPE